MKDIAFWALGTALAFVLTAIAFLLLANLLATPPGRNVAPPAPNGQSGSPLDLELDAAQLAGLEPHQSQNLSFTVRNEGEKRLSDIHLTLEVSSENTSLSETRYYRASIASLDAREFRRAEFDLDLSPPAGSEGTFTSGDLESPQTIVEIQATTPSGVSAVRTVILPLQADS